MSAKLYHMSIITHTGTTIYEQQLGQQVIDTQLLQSISTIALGFKNTIDINLSSINYLDYTIYFRRGENFLAVLLANNDPTADSLIDQMFTDLLEQKILADFIDFANHDLKCENTDIIKSVRKIIYNLDFVSSLSNFKNDLKNSTQRF